MRSIYTSQLCSLWLATRLYQNSKMSQNSLENSWFCQVMSLAILWAQFSHRNFDGRFFKRKDVAFE